MQGIQERVKYTDFLAELRPVTTLFVSLKEVFDVEDPKQLRKLQQMLTSMQSTIFKLEGFIRQVFVQTE